MARALEPGRIRLRGVSRSFRIVHDRSMTLKETVLRRGRVRATTMWALRGLDLDVAPGEAVGIVGANGSGKSTLLKLIAGIMPPDTGTVEVGGTIASMLELGAGFHPDFTGRENVYMNGSIYGLSGRQVDERYEEIVAFSELADFMDMPVRTYSSGMYMRLAFAIACHVNPDVLLLDEVLAVGDEAFQRKCMGRIFSFRRSGGTLVFVSHDAGAVERICDRAIVISEGLAVANGPTAEAFDVYHRILAGGGSAPAATAAPPPVPEAPPEGLAQEPAEPEPREEEAEEAAGDLEGWGSKVARIVDVRLRGADGAESDRFASGDRLVIEFDVEARHPVEVPVFGAGIVADTGEMMYGTNTKLDAFATERIEGRRTVRFAIDELALHEGNFHVQLSVVSHDLSEIYHWIDRTNPFVVFPQGSGIGAVRMRGAWSVESASVDLTR